MHINPIHSRPLSKEGRDNYDNIFRKPKREEAELRAAFGDRRFDKAKELYGEMAAAKRSDQNSIDEHQ